ncbi:TetR family transcriptional regulator [Actinomyces glycerinitolerans]|uniref:Tetr bacterial regulatory protein hth signature n=1 Tax=Actinomyces glycerinitolerans TaxID=1892869 RepID=A0A1M4S1L3_9ACTO|nr:TetR family transcriptional regulator [Actinomyces glycerinitolerans]SHE25877.1 tetr bacterial regulatory protein hth signature [Actinomyces glycerinitolerans]
MGTRGRRRAGSPDARQAILEAARAAFARDGYNASLRGIARAAGVDPALVHHYFPERSHLFVEAVYDGPDGPVMDPAVLDDVRRLPASRQGTALVRLFVTQWDRMGADRFAAVVRAALAHEGVVARIRELVVGALVTPLVERVAPDRVRLRSQLIAGHLVGLGMTRWIARLDAVSAASPEELAAAVGPVIQHYLTGDLGDAHDGPAEEAGAFKTVEEPRE